MTLERFTKQIKDSWQLAILLAGCVALLFSCTEQQRKPSRHNFGDKYIPDPDRGSYDGR